MSALFPGASRLGAGCASLGSRTGPRRGLRALEAAYDLGVNWFDVAPSYGDGLAEEIFSAFARGKRNRLHVCTKVGIRPPPVNAAMRLFRPLARAATRNSSALRSWVAYARGAPRPFRLDRHSIVASVELSLRRLGTDYVDVLALHEPSLDDVQSVEVMDALRGIVASGKARTAGIAGCASACALAATAGPPFGHLQLIDAPTNSQWDKLRRIVAENFSDLHIVTHSVFSTQLVANADSLCVSDRQRRRQVLNDYGYKDLDIEPAIRAVCLDYCLQSNPTGTVLLSMFGRGHARFAVERLSCHGRFNPSAVIMALVNRNAEAG